MYLSTVALCTWHCDKLVLRTCTFPTYSEFFVSVCCSPSAALLLRGSWQPRLTSTVLKRCSSSSSGGIGSLTPLVWPVEPGGADAAFPSFPAGASTLPAAFPISGYPIDPRNTHTNKNCSKEAAEKVNKCSVSSCLQLMFCEARDLSLFPWPRSVDPCWSSSHDSSIFSNKEKAGGWNPPVPLSEILVHYETLERGKGISWEWRTEWQLSEWKRKKGGGDRVQSLSLCTHNTRLQEDRKKKRKINKKRFHFWVPLCSGEWIKKKKKTLEETTPGAAELWGGECEPGWGSPPSAAGCWESPGLWSSCPEEEEEKRSRQRSSRQPLSLLQTGTERPRERRRAAQASAHTQESTEPPQLSGS